MFLSLHSYSPDLGHLRFFQASVMTISGTADTWQMSPGASTAVFASAVVLKHERVSEFPGGFVKTLLPTPSPELLVR